MNSRQFIYLLFLAELILSGFWYTGSAVTAMFLLAAGVAGCQLAFARQAFKAYAMSTLMLLYLLWLFVAGLLSAVPETALMTLAILAGLPVMYLFATNTSTFAETWRYLRTLLFLLGVVLALWAIWQVVHHVGYGYAQGPFQDRNVFAALMNLLWFSAAFVLLTVENSRYRLKRIMISAALFIISTALFATTSRGGMAAWLLLLPVFLWAAYRNHTSRKHMAILILLTVTAYLCSAMLLNASIADRTFQLNHDPSTAARLLLWQSGMKMLLAHPVFGSGWGTFVHYYPAYRVPLENSTAGFFAHNDYLQLAIEGGIPALLLQIGILYGVCIQLRRSLRQAADLAAFESAALMTGVLALFVHAFVNFIFYLAFMNILAGLYLARAAQLSEKARVLHVFNANRINPFFKYLAIGCIVLLIFLPYGAHVLGRSINKQRNVAIENLLSDQFSVYKLAELITLVQPQERISQETLLQTAELALADVAFTRTMDADSYRSLLEQTLQRFDSVRALNANDAETGVREARILIRHHAAFDAGFAYRKAHQVLSQSLKANPYHVDAIITLSRLQLAEGHAAEALQTMKNASAYILVQRDRQLIRIEFLRQLAAPETMPELDALEKELRKLRLGSETGKALILPDSYYPGIDARLNAIAYRIQHKTR